MGRIVGTFPIGDTGEFFGIAEWVPDPEEIAAELFKLANAIEVWAEPLEEAKQAFIYSTKLHFESESDPYGHKWEPLNETYAKYKQRDGFPKQILIRTGELERAATSEDAWFVEERSIVFKTEELPFYGGIHQAGTKTLIRRLFEHIEAQGRTLTPEQSQRMMQGTGTGKNIPQRMFIGADEDTIAEVESIFVDWLNRKTDEYIGGGRERGLGTGTNILGTFPIISFTSAGIPILRTPQGPRFGRL